MYDLIKNGIITLHAISVLSLIITLIVLPAFIYFKSKPKAARLLVISHLLFVGGLVFSLTLQATQHGRSLAARAIEYQSVLLLFVSDLGTIAMSISVILFPIGMWLFLKNINFDLNHSSSKPGKTIKQVSLCVSIMLIIALGHYVSYLQGLKTSHSSNTFPYMNILKMQNECIENEDYKCIRTTNSLTLDILAVHLETLKKHHFENAYIHDINDHLAWWNKTKRMQEQRKLLNKSTAQPCREP